jgi:hypothetical protein
VKIKVSLVRFQVLAAASMKMALVWVFAPCSLVEVYRRFSGDRPVDGESTSETSVNFYQTTRCNNPEHIFITVSLLR